MKRKSALLACLMLLSCVRLCNAQTEPQAITEAPVATPTATVTARLSNGAYVVTICAEGQCVEHQALPPAKVRELLTIKAERDSLAAQLQAVKEQVVILEKIKQTDERIAAGLTPEQVNVICGFREQGGMAGRHWFSASQFAMPTLKSYLAAREATGRFQRPYEDLRREYEDLRRPFSVSADVPYTDVWDFPTVQTYKGKHPCEKPLAMMVHIIRSSSRPGATVLDCFSGSGVTGEAAASLGRIALLNDRDEHWASESAKRLQRAMTHAPVTEIQQWRKAHAPKPAPAMPLFDAMAAAA